MTAPLIPRRVFTRGMAILLAVGTRTVTAESPNAPTVLFVCQFGSVKSAVAREVFRRMVAEQGASVKVISRGITPEEHASSALLARLQADGIDPSRDPLRSLDRAVLSSADFVVIFDPLPLHLVRSDLQDWSQMPSMNSDYDNARRFLDARLRLLLSTTQTRQQPVGARPENAL